MQSFDVIIVGGGPAGAAAGCALGRAGAKVLVLDKRNFPRDKLCAGLLTWKSLDALARISGETLESLWRFGVLDHQSQGYRVRCREREIVCREAFYPFHFVKRRVFDEFLLRRAAELGASVRTGERVSRVDIHSGEVWLENGTLLKARYVIGADGAQSRVRKGFSFDQDSWLREMGAAVEISLQREGLEARNGLHPDLFSPYPTVYAGFIQAGYSWVFPHRESLILGLVGLPKLSGEDVRAGFNDFLGFLGLNQQDAADLKGHALPFGYHLENPAQGCALLAGDAAGFADALFGEGIYFALRSGELAGQALSQALRDGAAPGPSYLAGLGRDIFPELDYSKKIRNIFFHLVKRRKFAPLGFIFNFGAKAFEQMVHGVRSYRWCARRAQGPSGRVKFQGADRGK